MSMLRAAGGRQRAFALRGLQLHQDRAEALGEVVVNVARQAIALLEDRLAAFLERASARRCGSCAARAPRVVRSLRPARCATTSRPRVPRPRRALIHPRFLPPRMSGATRVEYRPFSLLNSRTSCGRRAIVAAIFDGLFPAFLVVEEELRHREAREVGGPEVRVVEHLAEQVRHPEIAALLVFVDQPHAGGVALALFGQRLQQRAEERIEVGHAHEQVERVLRDLGLNVGETLGAPPLLRFTGERAPQFSRIARIDHALDALVDRACASAVLSVGRRPSRALLKPHPNYRTSE